MRLVFFDLETGGLDYTRHPIIQIAAIAVGHDLQELSTFECKLDFDRHAADDEALESNSYDPEVWAKEQVRPADAINSLSAFLRDHSDVQMISGRTGRPYYVAQLVGHNAATFDGPFLQRMFKVHDAFLPASYRVMDTLQRAIWYFHERPELVPPINFQLGTLCECFGVRLDNAHDALADVRATLALYRCLTAKGAVAA